MEPKIAKMETKYLIGMHMVMSISNNKTPELWQKFMPRRKEVKNRLNSEYISMQVFEKNMENRFAPETVFEKWAVVEVSEIEDIPEGMEKYKLSGGEYAVFIHKGPATTFPKTMQYIFGTWFPESKYEFDDRENFEVLTENYNPMDPEASEEVWIPIKSIL